jgi:addiction module HigA family antidote
MPIKNPPHPGDFIRTEIIEPAGLSVTGAAAALRVSRPALSSLLNGRADLSGDMALRIEKAFGVKMDTLMRMQSAYDIARTRKREKEIRVRRVHLRVEKIAPRTVSAKALLKKEKGVWVYQGEPTHGSIPDLIDREREKRSRDSS